MTTTGTRWSSAAMAAFVVALLATLTFVQPTLADNNTGDGAAESRTVVPEPATLAFVGIGAMALFRRRRTSCQ